MADLLMQNWWALAWRGAVAILFAGAAFLMPENALVTLVLLFAIYLIVDGVFAIIAGLRASARGRRRALIAEGAVGIVVGLVMVLWPQLSLLFFVELAAIWAIVSGVILLIAAVGQPSDNAKWLLLAGGGLSFLWGVVVLFRPMAGVVIWAWWIGAYALIFGAVMLAVSVRARRGLP
jgi:uncharacterized membrane protein HdeD (DUF308 family)